MIDRLKFFAAMRNRIVKGRLTRGQVRGAEAIFDFWQANHPEADRRFLAYILATAWHESAHTFAPLRETRARNDDEAISRLDRAFAAGRLPWVTSRYWERDEDGKSWYGRGLVQLTHKVNYQRLGERLGIDLVGNPSLALDLGHAVEILVTGMIEGLYTGKRLKSYFNGRTEDYIGARRIITGPESAELVAGHARNFLRALGPA